MVYQIIWSYDVYPEFISEFEFAYSKNGMWSQFFKKSEYYIRTDLLKGTEKEFSYLTTDVWDDLKEFSKFKKTYILEYNHIDTLCEKYTSNEVFIGNYLKID